MNTAPRDLSDSEGPRLLLAFAVQPPLAAAVAFVLFPLIMLDGDGRHFGGGYPSSVADAALSVAFGVGIVAAAVTFIGVLPIALWLMKRRQLTLVDALMCGLGFGQATYLGLLLLTGGNAPHPAWLVRGVLFSCAIAVVGAAVFWVIALRPRRQPAGA